VTPDAGFPVINVEKGHYSPKFAAQWEASTALPRLLTVDGGIRSNVAPGQCQAQVKGLKAEDAQSICDAVSARTGVSFHLSADGDVLTLEAKGAEAHASTPEEGKNAITALLEVLCALPLAQTGGLATVQQLHSVFPFGDHRGAALGIAQEDEASGVLTLTFSVLHLNETGFQGQFDVRAPICANADNCTGVVEKTFTGFGWSIEGTMSQVHAVDANSPFIHTLLRSYEHFSGKKGFCMAIGGGTYVHEIPGGVAFGAGDDSFDSHLHGANERAMISQLLMCAKIYAAVIADLCQ
jgi:succinyl-diaminopimelate desuccinylase